MPIQQLTPKRQSSWKRRPLGLSSTPKKSRSRRQKTILIIQILAGLFLLGVVLVVAAFAWYSKDLPDPNRILQRNVVQSTKIYDRTGENILYEIHGEEKRTVIPLNEIPENMRWATITIEDRQFYSHHGFSLRGLVRAVFSNIFKGLKSQGGSTITQQFIKNAILTSEKSFTRKIKEVVLSYQMERKFTKDQILQLYLNEIPYGSSAYGVESAANTYFGKKAKDLTLAECALLAALPQAPTYYSPYGSHREDLVGRQHYILNTMVELGYITKQQAEEAKGQKLEFKQKIENIQAPHFVMYVKELLTEKYGERMVEQGGLKVYTTLDFNKQQIAEAVVKEGAVKNERYKASNAALVAIDAKTGEVLAMVGSKDFFNEDIDGQVNVALRGRQPGSSFKPVVYATAFAKGYTPETMLLDLKTNFGNYSPSNYDLTEHGPLSMRKALAGSLNIPAVMTLYLAGIDQSLDTAHKMGYTTLNDRERYGLSLVLGGGEVKLLDHVAAFSVFAREGVRHPARAVLKVQDQSGKVLEENKETKGEEVINKKVGQQINSILSDNSARAFIFGSRNYLTLAGRPVAAKTGTTSDFHDGWTVGYTPSLAAGVWVGNNDNSAMSRGADGSVVAAPIWHEFMSRVLSGTPVETFHAPPPEKVDKPILRGEIDVVTSRKVDKFSGKLIPQSCLATYPKEYIKDINFKETHNILFWVNKNDPRGPVPENPSKDPQYARWEAPVQAWAKNHGYPSEEYESCNRRASNLRPTITITSPSSGATLMEDNFDITTLVSAASDHSIVKVEYYIDTTLIDSVSKKPFQTTYLPTNLTNGAHKLTVRTFDEVGNVAESVVSFSYQSTKGTSVYFISPAQASTLIISGFPQPISVYAYDPSGIARVDFYYFDASLAVPDPGLIGSVDSPSTNSVGVVWDTPPSPGKYKLYVSVLARNQIVTKSDYLSITIK